MPEGDHQSSDDALWAKLEQLPDIDDQPAHFPRDERQFHVRAPNGESPGSFGSPAEPPPAEPPGLDPQPWPPPPQRRRARRRSPWVRVLLAVLALAMITIGGFAIWGWVLWTQVDHIETDDSLSPPSEGFVNYLIVGTDSRAGLSAELETADSIGLRVGGERSDTMVVLHVGGSDNHMVSIPRDLWVPIDGGASAKLNGARALGGVPSLIRTIRANPGIPIHHYLEVDIAGFLSVIEAIDTITITFPSAACDPKSGLDVRATGAAELDPEQALAYVRSRTYTEFDPSSAAGLSCAQIRERGLGRTVGNSDFGRTERQRTFLLAVFDKVAATRNPVTLLRLLGGLTEGLRVDDTMGMFDAIELFRGLRGLDASTHALPVSDFTTPTGASALALNAASAEVIALLTD